jgi:3-oxoacyl-(acyl-carrier-protein) synthase
MDNFVITAASMVTGDNVRTARLGKRFGRMDLMSQLALLAVESLGVNFDAVARERVAICLAAGAGSLSTDLDYWKGRDARGGPSPTLFAYTLPSAAIGELAMRHRLTGPNLCFVGGSSDVLPEAAELIWRGEADGCVCVSATVVSPALAQLISAPAAASACALFLQRGGDGLHALAEIGRDMETLCAKFCARKSTT